MELKTSMRSYEPPDANCPVWPKPFKCSQDWKDHVPDLVRMVWDTFTPEQRKLLASWAHGLQEEWV